MILRFRGVFVILGALCNSVIFAAQPTDEKQTVKLSPHIRVQAPIREAVTVPIEKLQPFLQTSVILNDKQQLIRAPYVIAEGNIFTEDRAANRLYVKGLKEVEETQYNLCQGEQMYRHPITKEILGFETKVIGTAELKSPGEVAEFQVNSMQAGIEVGTKLLPKFTAELPSVLEMVYPTNDTPREGYILSMREGAEQIGSLQIVVISLGLREKIKEGNVLDIYQTGNKVIDPYSKSWFKEKIQLPDRRIGKLLVFQVYDKLSLGLVLETTDIIRLLDKVKSS